MITPMNKMCDNCPFGHSPEQRHMRDSLMPGRFNEICQSVFLGFSFICHKTTTHDDDGEYRPGQKDRECAGAIAFREAAITNRERADRRASRTARR
jgi:hypothetical protein